MKNIIKSHYIVVEHYRDATPGFKEHRNSIMEQSNDLNEIKELFSKYKDHVNGYDEYSYSICDVKNHLEENLDSIDWQNCIIK